jgi:hypothetical protein
MMLESGPWKGFPTVYRVCSFTFLKWQYTIFYIFRLKKTYPILGVLASLIFGDSNVLGSEGLERFLGGLYLSKEPVLILS